jgi:hypothetical protein
VGVGHLRDGWVHHPHDQEVREEPLVRRATDVGQAEGERRAGWFSK